jgi:hypothetical protein
MKRLIALALLAVFLCTGFLFACDNCEELEWELNEAEERISELESDLEDLELEYASALDDAMYYFSWAEEYLSGQFEDVDVDEALDAVQQGMNYISRIR